MKNKTELQRLLDLSIKIKEINDEIRIEIEKRVFDLTAMIRMKEIKH